VPGILVKYDSRSAELANTHAIPSVELSELGGMDVERMVARPTSPNSTAIYALRYDKMRFVLEQNGLQHRMGLRRGMMMHGRPSSGRTLLLRSHT
jgi:hypothetical protein